MKGIRIQQRASRQLDEIYQYTLAEWGQAQADRYIQGLFESFHQIANHGIVSRPIPAEFGVQGFFYRHEKHFVYWKTLESGDIGIVTILHQRMHQIERFRADFNPGTSN